MVTGISLIIKLFKAQKILKFALKISKNSKKPFGPGATSNYPNNPSIEKGMSNVNSEAFIMKLFLETHNTFAGCGLISIYPSEGRNNDFFKIKRVFLSFLPI